MPKLSEIVRVVLRFNWAEEHGILAAYDVYGNTKYTRGLDKNQMERLIIALDGVTGLERASKEF